MLDLTLSGSLIKALIIEAMCNRYAALVRGSADGKATLPGAANAAGFVGFAQYAVDSDHVGVAQPVIIDSGITYVNAKSAFPSMSLLRIADNLGNVEAIPSSPGVLFNQTVAVIANVATLNPAARFLVAVTTAAQTGMLGPFVQLAGHVVVANVLTLGFTADALLSAHGTIGGTPGFEAVINAGSIPSAGQACLSADHTQVKFANADAITTATVDVLTSSFSRPGRLQILPQGSTPGPGQCVLSADGTQITFNAADAITSVIVDYVVAPAANNNVVALALGAAAAINDQVPALIVRGIAPSMS